MKANHKNNITNLKLLRKAIIDKNYDLCKLLVANGANCTYEQLRDAVINQDLELCKILVTANNIDEIINAVDTTNQTFLYKAADSNNTKICEILVSAGADVNKKDIYGNTPLSNATKKGNTDLCELLFQHGADANISDGYYTNPLKIAIRNNNYELCKLLIENGAKISREQLRDAVNDENLELCNILVTANNIDEIINAVDTINQTFLNKAAYSNNTKICEVLLSAGGDVNKKNIYKKTPLSNAAERGNTDLCKLLFQHGADANISDGYYTNPLIIAIRNKNYELCELLITNGAKFSAAQLLSAANNQDLKLCKLLIESDKLDLEKLSKDELEQYQKIKTHIYFEEKALEDIEIVKKAHNECNSNSTKPSFVPKSQVEVMLEYYLKGYKKHITDGENEFFDNLATKVVECLNSYTKHNWPQLFCIAKKFEIIRECQEAPSTEDSGIIKEIIFIPKNVIGLIGEHLQPDYVNFESSSNDNDNS